MTFKQCWIVIIWVSTPGKFKEHYFYTNTNNLYIKHFFTFLKLTTFAHTETAGSDGSTPTFRRHHLTKTWTTATITTPTTNATSLSSRLTCSYYNFVLTTLTTTFKQNKTFLSHTSDLFDKKVMRRMKVVFGKLIKLVQTCK